LYFAASARRNETSESTLILALEVNINKQALQENTRHMQHEHEKHDSYINLSKIKTPDLQL